MSQELPRMARPEEWQAWEQHMKDDVDVNIYAMGPLSMSVCSLLGPDETLQRVNHLMEGVTTWHLSEDETFATGEPQPGPCELHAGRTHYLLS